MHATERPVVTGRSRSRAHVGVHKGAIMFEAAKGAIRGAWARLESQISAEELARRMGRRYWAASQRAVTGCWLGLRAGDGRLTEVSACRPGEIFGGWRGIAGELNYLRTERRHEPEDFQLRFGVEDIRRLCRPIVIPRHANISDVALLTGRHPITVWQGCFFGRWDAPVTYRPNPVWTSRMITRIAEPFVVDPNWEKFKRGRWVREEGRAERVMGAEDVWGFDVVAALEALPGDFEQTIRRVVRRVPNRGVVRRSDGALVPAFECPSCGKIGAQLIWPQPVPEVIGGGAGEAEHGSRGTERKNVATGEVLRGFACWRCWGVWGCNMNAGAWNTIVGRLSGFRLYGKEVEMPGEVRDALRFRWNGLESPKTVEAMEMYQSGKSVREIARELGVRESCVYQRLDRARFFLGFKRRARGGRGMGRA